jgi:inhibitor of KinA sporulation pathway (predicted exonuclease)
LRKDLNISTKTSPITNGRKETKYLADIFNAFASISQTNVHLGQLFAEEEEIVKSFELFAGVLEEAYKLDGKLDDQSFKQQDVQNHLSPAFQAWKLVMQQALKKYIEQ